MIAELHRGRAEGASREQLVRQLRLAPWCWPADADADALAFARSLVPQPSAQPPGLFLGVTVSRGAATLWRIDASAREDAVSEATLAPDARQAWDAAACAVPRSLPIMWTSLSDSVDRGPVLHRIESYLEQGTASLEYAIKGPSFGLAFAIALASRAIGRPVPIGSAALAAVSADGVVLPVEGMSLKVGCLRALAPQITTIFVHSGQEAEARACAGSIRVEGVNSLSAVLSAIFGDALAGALAAQIAEPTLRPELIKAFLRLVLMGRRASISWRPIEEAALKASAHPELSTMDRALLEFTAAVAARHDRNAGFIPNIPEDWLENQPLPLRLSIAAHIVQHAADLGQPSNEEVDRWVARYSPPSIREAFPHHLRLLGAQARLWAVTGRPVQALARQQELARAWWAILEAAPVSFPLSECYRLSGACEDRAAFEEAERLLSEIRSARGFSALDEAYVRLARARAATLLGLRDADELESELVELQSPHLPDNIRRGAAFGQFRLSGRIRSTPPALPADVPPSDEHTALAALEIAVRSGAGDDARSALDALAVAVPGIIRHLRQAAAEAAFDAAPYVLRFYPY